MITKNKNKQKSLGVSSKTRQKNSGEKLLERLYIRLSISCFKMTKKFVIVITNYGNRVSSFLALYSTSGVWSVDRFLRSQICRSSFPKFCTSTDCCFLKNSTTVDVMVLFATSGVVSPLCEANTLMILVSVFGTQFDSCSSLNSYSDSL